MSNKLALNIDRALPGERTAVEKLLQLYLHDFSVFADPGDAFAHVDDQGTFSYDFFEDYWQGNPKREVHLFRVNGSLAGFAFLNDWPPSGRAVDWCVAEFFVMRKYRRSGIGGRAAAGLLADRPALWEVGVKTYNTPALHFWRKMLGAAPATDLEEIAVTGDRWTGSVFRFST